MSQRRQTYILGLLNYKKWDIPKLAYPEVEDYIKIWNEMNTTKQKGDSSVNYGKRSKL